MKYGGDPIYNNYGTDLSETCSYLGEQAFVKRFPTKAHIFKCAKAGS